MCVRKAVLLFITRHTCSMSGRKLYSYGSFSSVKQTPFPSNPKLIPGLGGVLHPKLYYSHLNVSRFQPNTNLISNDPGDDTIVKPDEKLLSSTSESSGKSSKNSDIAGSGQGVPSKQVDDNIGLDKPVRLTKEEIKKLKRKSKSCSTKKSKVPKHNLKISN